MKKNIIIIATLLIISTFTTITFAASGTTVGDSLPTFNLTTLNGSTITIMPAGKPMVLNFWRLGCGYCHEEMPALMKFANDYSQTVDFYSVDVVDSSSDVQNYFSQYGFYFANTVLLNGDMSIWQQFRSRGVPLTIVADRSGVIRHRLLGALTYNELENYVADSDHF